MGQITPNVKCIGKRDVLYKMLTDGGRHFLKYYGELYEELDEQDIDGTIQLVNDYLEELRG